MVRTSDPHNGMNDCLCQNRLHPQDLHYSRREFLARCGMGLGALGLASLLSEEVLGAVSTASPVLGRTHFPAKANHVIHIFAQGAPSHVDTWDPKPNLAKYADQNLPGLNGVAMPSPFTFSKCGFGCLSNCSLTPPEGFKPIPLA